MRDGVKDGVIEDPSRCNFDPEVMKCTGADNNNCLTAAQADAARQVYQMPRHSRTKEPIYGYMSPGSELDWASMIGRPEPYPYSQSYYRYMVYRDPNWTYANRPANFDTDVDLAEAPQNLVINHTNPDLSGFIGRGGKLLLVGGWNDNLPVQNVIAYYERVVATMGADKVRNAVTTVCRSRDAPLLRRDASRQLQSRFRLRSQPSGNGRRPIAHPTTSSSRPPARMADASPSGLRVPAGFQVQRSGSTDDPSSFACQAP